MTPFDLAARLTAPVATTQPATPRVAPAEETEVSLDRLYHLVLLDDDQHSYEYVIEMLGRVFGYAREKAFVLARIVDTEGRVILETASHEQVTRHQERVHGYGPDPRISTSKGSMSAVVEEA